jgi:hypothetical protein
VSAYNICKVLRSTDRSRLPLDNGNISVINFGQKRPKVLSKEISSYTNVNRNRDLPTSMSVPVEPTVAPMNKSCHQNAQFITFPFCSIYIYHINLDGFSVATSSMRGRTVHQFVETLAKRQKVAGWIPCYHWKFSVTYSSRPLFGLGFN